MLTDSMTANPRRHGMRWVVWGALLAGGGCGYWYWRQHQATGPQYQTVPVANGDLIQSVTATGTLNPVANVQVGSQISGIIKNIYVDWNSPVKEGQVIAQIDPATFQATVHQAEGNLANAKAALELAEINEHRARKMLQDRLIPQADYDQARANLHEAQAQVMINQAALENAQINLERCTISSPTNGIVISRNVDVGQTVAASFNTPTLFIIANDLAKMQIDADVAEADIGGVDVGQDVNFTVDAFPYRTFHGKVVQVRNSPVTVQNVVSYDTVIAVDNPDLKLRPGMTANVSVVVARRNGVLEIPNAALRFRPPEALAAGRAESPTRTQHRPGEAGGDRGAEGFGNRARSGRAGGAGPPRAHEGGRFANQHHHTDEGEHPIARTIYVLAAQTGSDEAKPRPVRVLTGISDGIHTEVIDGLRQGEQVVTGLALTPGGPARMQNPFFRRRF